MKARNDEVLVNFVKLLSKKGYTFLYNGKDYKSPYGLLGNLKKRYKNYNYAKYYKDFPLRETVHVFGDEKHIGQFNCSITEHNLKKEIVMKIDYGFISPNNVNFNDFDDIKREAEFLTHIDW